MHTKETVWYLCHEYVVSGAKFYYKREKLTTDSYRKLESVYWSKPKPISKWTFEKAQKEGYKCLIVKHFYPPGDIQKNVISRASQRTYHALYGTRKTPLSV